MHGGGRIQKVVEIRLGYSTLSELTGVKKEMMDLGSWSHARGSHIFFARFNFSVVSRKKLDQISFSTIKAI